MPLLRGVVAEMMGLVSCSHARNARRAGALIVLAACLTDGLAVAQDPAARESQPSGPATTAAPLAPRSPESRVSAQMARQMAGTWADPCAVVENLPGVVRPWSESDGLAVWGARPGDSRVLVDGLEVPALLHVGSQRCAVGVNAPAHVDLLPGAYGADYGRALGGLVLIGTRDLPIQGSHVVAEASLADASLAFSAAPASRFRFGVAGTWSYADRMPAALGERVAAFYGPPRYRDFQAKLELDLSPQRRLTAVAMGAAEHAYPLDDFLYYTTLRYPPHDRTLVPDRSALHRWQSRHRGHAVRWMDECGRQSVPGHQERDLPPQRRVGRLLV